MRGIAWFLSHGLNPAGLEPATCRLGNDGSRSSELRVPGVWLRRQDLNLRRRIMSPSLAALRLQCTPRQTFQTGYGGRIRTYINEFQRLAPFQFGHSVRFDLVDLARFERATSTFAESRSDSPELQIRDCSGGKRAALTAASAVARSPPNFGGGGRS